MRRTWLLPLLLPIALALVSGSPTMFGAGGQYTLIGWNNLGMHCMDPDYSVFSILPPYNTIHAQLVDPQGVLVSDPAGITVTYEAVADSSGSINTTSINKTNFWEHVLSLFGASPDPDTGLTGMAMPGVVNAPRAMTWDAAGRSFVAEGIPITPYEDRTYKRNPYPMMRLTARDGSGNVLATTDIVLPVSDEMDCSVCHRSNSVAAAKPPSGWVNHPDATVDYRLNVLLLHDSRHDGSLDYLNALAAAGYDPMGLYVTATQKGTSVLCARCHASNALPGTGLPGMAQLTASVHAVHAEVIDPVTGMALGNSADRSACYRCHPGSETRCLRGAMGRAVAADGTMEMQCQNCHGSMSAVGALNRVGWLDEPACQNCHTGTATSNNGLIRYTSAIDSSNRRRQAVDSTFATNPDTPLPGVSLYRFSYGHGGLACEACHGATHAEYPATHQNDNVQAEQLQGHAGVISDCATCHVDTPATVSGGPHGMHAIGQSWVGRHGDVAEGGGSGRCRDCHGTDLKGTVLSHALGDRTVSSVYGQRHFWQGFRIGCYACHKGPSNDSKNGNRAPRALDGTVSGFAGSSASATLAASDPEGNPVTYRIISQPSHGAVGVNGTVATYHPDNGFTGEDSFTFAAWDGQIDSNLGTVRAIVGADTCALTCSATVASEGQEGTAVPFAVAVATTGCLDLPSYAWSFGDGQTSAAAAPSHAYAMSGNYVWEVKVAADAAACSASGTIAIGGRPPIVTDVVQGGQHFLLKIPGSNLHPTIQVFIGGTRWTNVSWVSQNKIVLKGRSSLKALFPAGTWVTIRLVNPDDSLETSIEYNRTLKQWRPAES